MCQSRRQCETRDRGSKPDSEITSAVNSAFLSCFFRPIYEVGKEGEGQEMRWGERRTWVWNNWAQLVGYPGLEIRELGPIASGNLSSTRACRKY